MLGLERSLALRRIATGFAQDLRERFNDASRVTFASENRVLAVHIVHVTYLLPVPGERRRILKLVQDQLDLGLSGEDPQAFVPPLVR